MAYGARLESVLGASPRGFESPILRQLPRTISRVRGNVYIGFPYYIGVSRRRKLTQALVRRTKLIIQVAFARAMNIDERPVTARMQLHVPRHLRPYENN